MNSLNKDVLNKIFTYINLEFLICITMTNNYLNNLSRIFIKDKYCKYKYINIFKLISKRSSVIEDNIDLDDILESSDIKLSNEIYILYELIKQFNINYEKCDYLQNNLKNLKEEITISCKKRKIKSIPIVVKYIGMGHLIVLYNILDTDKYFLTNMGGSNGYEHEDNEKKLLNLTIDKVKLFNLDDGIEYLFKNYNIINHSN